jgi:DNA modification methylase
MSAQTVIHGNCMQVLKNYASETFDIVVLDPPISMHENWITGNEARDFLALYGISRVTKKTGITIILTNPAHGYIQRQNDLQSFHAYPALVTHEEFGLKHVRPFSPLLEILCPHVNPASKVLDPFCGSGTTLAVAQVLGAEAVGIDLDEKCVAVSMQRTRY